MTRVRFILVVADDPALRAVLAEHLTLDGEFAASEAGTANEAHAKLLMDDARYDAVILDVGLPDGDGRDLCAKLRRQGVKIPIIMLAGSDEESDIVRGLNAGANDYITKPFRFSELLARLRAQLRTVENSQDAVFSIGPYAFRPAAKLLQDLSRKRKIHLTDKESGILKFLYRADGRAVTRRELLNEVWGYNALVSTHTLETHIYRLRQKMEVDPNFPTLLLTKDGGYKLISEPDTELIPNGPIVGSTAWLRRHKGRQSRM